MADDTYAKLISLLDDSGARYRLIDHAPEGKTEAVSRLRGHDTRAAAKCVILMVKLSQKTTKYVLAVIPGDRRVNLAAVKTLFNASYVSFASAPIAERLAGSMAGTILPFAFSKELELLADPALQDVKELYFNAARLDRSVALSSTDYFAIAKPRPARIAEEFRGAGKVALAAEEAAEITAASSPNPLAVAARHAEYYLAEIGNRHVGALIDGNQIRQILDSPLPEVGENSQGVIDDLARAGISGTVASQGPRYFGFVNGGSFPVATAADWLVSAWDQNAQVYVMSPLASVVEEISSRWLKDLLGFPLAWSVGLVTGAQMANFTGLITARHHVLRELGWDVERDGLFGAPPIQVVVSDEAHRTIFTALRMLGLGSERLRRVKTDLQGRMRVGDLADALRGSTGPCIVCAQVGNVNTGAADPLAEIVPILKARGGWLHVDAAFGAWAAVSSSLRHLVTGIEEADSVATDGHKWLNVPYDCGIVFTAHPESHQQALLMPAHYIQMTPGERDARAFTPDESRRARGVTVYATLRSLGRSGVRELVERLCNCARHMAENLRGHPQVRILNSVELNQVLVQFVPLPGDHRDQEAYTEAIVLEIQKEGTCWLGTTKWQGHYAARISICNWATSLQDIDRSATAILGVIDRTNHGTRSSNATQ